MKEGEGKGSYREVGKQLQASRQEVKEANER